MLKGSLQTVALPEVLNFLADTGKSGQFHVSGSHGDGRIWFDQGRISGLEVDRAQEPSEAIFELLRIDDGEFDFASDAERPEDAVVVDAEAGAVAPALDAAQAKLAEWRDIVAVVPSLSHRVQLRAETPAEQVLLEPEQWMMVVAIGAGHSVAEVIDAREMQEFDGCKAVRGLVEMSLVEVLDRVAEEVGSAGADEPVAGGSAVEEPVVELVAVDEPVVDESMAEDVVGAHDGAVNGSAFGFGVTESHEPWDATSTVEDEPSEPQAAEEQRFSPFSFGSNGADTLGEPREGDHYAALRAAMVEIGDHLATDDPDGVDGELAHPVYEFHADPEMDGRAALHALLSEVSEDAPVDEGVRDEAVDGLADRGPWTEHELSAMDSHKETWDEPVDESNIVPFAPVHSSDEGSAQAGELGELGDGEAAEAEESAPTEEPINRGLLLKFLSSVRN